MRRIHRLLGIAVAVLLVVLVAVPLAAQQPPPPAAQPAPITSLPDDLAAYVKQLGEMAQTDKQAAQRSIAQAGRLVPKTTLQGENVVYGALLAIRANQYKPALDLSLQYLQATPRQRELALAVAIESASWITTELGRARELYADYTRSFEGSRTADPLKGRTPLRVTVEEAMARVAYLDGEDTERAATHYQNALKAIEAAGRDSVMLDNLFRLRWYYADAIASVGRSEEALAYLYETRPIVKGERLLELQLEDFILFKETDKLLNQGKYAEARAILEKRLPEFEPAPVNKRRITKLLDRVKLVGAPAPDLAANIRWVGGGPHTLPDLRGQVVMLEFFTSG
jgi:tetratricopeptide (TPR) repeat protein